MLTSAISQSMRQKVKSEPQSEKESRVHNGENACNCHVIITQKTLFSFQVTKCYTAPTS